MSTTAEEYRDIHGDGIVTARECRTESQHGFKVSDASVLSYNTLAMAINMILSIVRHEEHFRTRRLGNWASFRFEVRSFVLSWAHWKEFVSVTGFKRETNQLSKTVCLKQPKTMENSQNNSCLKMFAAYSTLTKPTLGTIQPSIQCKLGVSQW